VTERWAAKADIDAALERFERAIPGWARPAAYGLGVAVDGEIVFPHVNVGEHHLPAVVLATICGHVRGTGVYPLTPAQLDQAIALLTPAEACDAYDHPNLRAWRQIRADHPDAAVAVFVGDLANPPAGVHDERFRRFV